MGYWKDIYSSKILNQWEYLSSCYVAGTAQSFEEPVANETSAMLYSVQKREVQS